MARAGLSAFALGAAAAFLAACARTAAPSPAPVHRTVDRALDELAAEGGSDVPRDLADALDELDAAAFGVDARLRVLKRRSRLADLRPASVASYAAAAAAASDAYPSSEALAAVAAEARLRAGDAVGASAFAPRISDPRYFPVLAAAAARSGALADPRGIAEIDRAAALLSAAAEAYEGPSSLLLSADAAAALAAAGDQQGARILARDRLAKPAEDVGADDIVLLLLADLEYDFGDPSVAAAYYSRSPAASAQLKHADAQYLAGDLRKARESWKAGTDSAPSRALYNLAATSSDAAEALSCLTRLLAAVPGDEDAAIAYSRSLRDADAVSFLKRSLGAGGGPLIELELLRRSAPEAPPGRVTAELWRLLNEHGYREDIARWAAYHMAREGSEDAAVLVDRLRPMGMSAAWLDFHEGLVAAERGETTRALDLFKKAAAADGDWRLAANAALALEASRSPRDAAALYLLAARGAEDARGRSTMLSRRARCLQKAGDRGGALRTLEEAVAADPTDPTARAALRKLEE